MSFPLIIQAADGWTKAGQYLGVLTLVVGLVVAAMLAYMAFMWAKVPFEIRTIRETLQRIEASRKTAGREIQFPRLDPEPVESR